MKRIATVLLLVAALAAASTALAQAQRWEYGVFTYSEYVASMDPVHENQRTASFLAPGVYVYSGSLILGGDVRAVLVHEDFIEQLGSTYAVQREDWWEMATRRTLDGTGG